MRTVLAASLVLLWAGMPAFAHRLDEYLQDTTFSLGRDRVGVEMRLTPGVGVLRTVLGLIDIDGDGVISEAEQAGYARRVLGDVSLSVDGHPLSLSVRSATFAGVEEMREGLGEIVLELDADVPGSGAERRLVFENRHGRGISAYLVNCLVPSDPAVRVRSQSRSYDQAFYELDYVRPWTRSGAVLASSGTVVWGWLGADGVVVAGWLGGIVWRRRRRRRQARSPAL